MTPSVSVSTQCKEIIKIFNSQARRKAMKWWECFFVKSGKWVGV